MPDFIAQRSDAWRAARAGKLTASRFGDVIAVKKDGTPTAARDKYLKEIVFERLAGAPRHEINGQALKWGTELEAFAREAYEIHSGALVMPASFIVHPAYPFIGCSPDGGLVDADGLIEIKCPMDEAVHIQTWLTGMPRAHRPQVQGALMVTGRQWCDFISYDPRMHPRFQLYQQRIERDEAYIEQLLTALCQFEREVNQLIARLETMAA